MDNKSKLHIAGLAFISLLIFTEPGREVAMELLGTIFAILAATILGGIVFIGVELVKYLFNQKKSENYTKGNVYKNKQ